MHGARFKRFRPEHLLVRNVLMILLLVSAIGLVVLIGYFYLDDIYLAKTRMDLQGVADDISQMALSDKEKLETDLSDIEAKHNFYIELYYPRDQLIYTTDTNNATFDPQPNDPKKDEPLKPRIMRILEHTDQDDVSYFETRQEYFASAKYIVYGTLFKSGVAVEIYASLEQITDNAQTAFWLFFIAAIFLVVVILFVLIFHTVTFTIPVDKISRITKKMAQMDFSAVCPPFRLRELDELSTNINILSSSLDMTMQTLTKRNEQLERDIENEQKLRENRKQFIASASHELKTPIAIIQGYAEGLKFGIYDDNPGECYDVILEEAQKMNQLVIDMLEVDRLNSTKIEPHYVVFSLHDRLLTFVEQMRNITIKNGITVTCDIDPSFYARSDETLFERVFSNYFSNAISHCADPKQIVVTCRDFDEHYRISVFNTGLPIADNDLINIWNSFYRADKAHSRAEGRFGLGLSIVSSAQQAQQMQYGVENHDDGVEFWFDVRKAKA